MDNDRMNALLDILSGEVSDSENSTIDQIAQTILMSLAIWRLQKELPRHELDEMIDRALSRFRHNAVKQFRTQDHPVSIDEFNRQLEQNLGKARWRLREIFG